MLKSWLHPYLRSPESTGGGGGNGTPSGPAPASPSSTIVLGGNPQQAPPDGDAAAKAAAAAAQANPGDQDAAAKAAAAAEAAAKGGEGDAAAKAAAAKAAEEAGKGEFKWDINTFLESIGVKGLKADDPRLKQWGDVKGMLSKAMEVNTQLSARVAAFDQTEAQLKADLETAKKGVKEGTATPAEVQAARAELEKLRNDHKADLDELGEYRATKKLAENPAFKEKYDGGRASLFAAAKETAEKIKLDPAKLDEVFAAESEYDIRKVVATLDIEDEVAEKMIVEKALAHRALTTERENLLAGKNGKKASELATEWEGYHAQMGGAMTRRFTAALQGQLLEAVDKVKPTLAEASPTFKTPMGEQVLEEIRARFQEGFDLPTEEVVQAMAWQRIGPIHEKVAVEQAQRIRELEAQVAQLTGHKPNDATKQGSQDAAKPTIPSINEDVFSPRKPTITLGSPAASGAMSSRVL
jgi:hypothetical protein